MRFRYLPYILFVLLCTTCLQASVQSNSKLSNLELEQFIYLTDTTGVLSPLMVSKATAGRFIRIFKTDGTLYEGTVTSVEESDDIYKIYGQVNGQEDVRFGFVLAKGGIFAGALVDKKQQKTYIVQFSQAHKGYILVFTTFYDKNA